MELKIRHASYRIDLLLKQKGPASKVYHSFLFLCFGDRLIQSIKHFVIHSGM